MTDHIKSELEGGVLRLTFARPDKKNAITQEMYTVLSDALAGADENRAVHCVLFDAEGDVFTAGNDMADFVSAPPDVSNDDELPPVGRFLRALATATTPLVAAVDGKAVGVGTTMLFHCDQVIASSRALFQTPFANLALVPEAASSLILPVIAGHQRAAELLMLGRRISAERAERFGFVNEIVEPENLSSRARAVADEIASLPPEAVRLSKTLLRGDPEARLQRIAEEGKIFAERLGSPEFKEAATAFMEKRAPDFSKIA